MKSTRTKTLYLVELSILTALTIVLQLLGSLLTGFTGLPMSFVLIPIVIAAIHLGPMAGAWLGAVFGIVTIIMGFSGLDPFTNVLLNNFGIIKMLICIALCMVKAIVAGLGSGFLYKGLNKLFKGKNVTLTTILAAVAAPLLNTGIFIIGMLLFYFNDTAAIQAGIAEILKIELPKETIVPPMKYIFLVLVGWNFISEFAINLIISPAVSRVIDVVRKKRN